MGLARLQGHLGLHSVLLLRWVPRTNWQLKVEMPFLIGEAAHSTSSATLQVVYSDTFALDTLRNTGSSQLLKQGASSPSMLRNLGILDAPVLVIVVSKLPLIAQGSTGNDLSGNTKAIIPAFWCLNSKLFRLCEEPFKDFGDV